MKRTLFSLCAILTAAIAEAGGLMTNTNYHISFDRMMARGASFDIDAVFSNPAGLAWTHDGLQLSLQFQKPWQQRDIETDIPGYLAVPQLGYPGIDFHQKFDGDAYAPIVPAVFASYKKDRWAVGAMIGITGSGGYVKFNDGVPMFNVLAMGKIFQSTATLPTGPITPDKYIIDSKMEGKQYIYGGQVNLTYRLTDALAASVGFRASYYDGYYKGHITTDMQGTPLIDLQLDCDQTGWGYCPIVGLDYRLGPVTLAARYEFRTKLDIPNDTKQLDAKMLNPATQSYVEGAAALAQFGDKVADYEDGAKTRYDMPSLLTVAVGYEITPKLRATAEYHFFDDKHAKMANDRQKELEHGTHEFLLGAEYDVNDRLTLSCGGQRTDYGLSDTYQQNTSFACDSYSIGLGAAVNLTEKMRLTAGYFITLYSDYTREYPTSDGGYLGTGYAGKDIYSRTNNVIGIGLDYKF